MPFELRLSAFLRAAGWKVKIRDKEAREPPHVTILRRTTAWRINLRSGQFMDDQPNPNDVPKELLEVIREEESWQALCDAWDRMYPANPVGGPKSTETEDDDGVNQ